MYNVSAVLLCTILLLTKTEQTKLPKEKWVARITPRQEAGGNDTLIATERTCRLHHKSPDGADFSIDMILTTVCCPAGVTPVLEGATSNCSRYQAECERLKCKGDWWHVTTEDGCLSCCQCKPFEPSCRKETEECNSLTCEDGIEKTVGPEGCERCTCKVKSPCDPDLVTCLDSERCVAVPDSSPLTSESTFYAECRPVIKPGVCPLNHNLSEKVACEHGCTDDADCSGIAKCCSRGCKKICLEPVIS